MKNVHPTIQSILEAHGAPKARPDEPPHGTDVWYRGWECGYDATAAFWGAEPWRAAKGDIFCECCNEAFVHQDGLCRDCWNETNGQFGVGA